MITQRKVWALTTVDGNSIDTSLHNTKREALEELASVYGIESEGLTDEQLDAKCNDLQTWVVLKKVGVPDA